MGRVTIPLLLWVNVLEDQLGNDANRKLCDATITSIKKAKNDFLRLNIIDMYHTLSRDEAESTLPTGGPWGLLMRKAYDIVAMTAHSIVQRSSVEKDVAIIRNDSDAVDIDPDYFETYLSTISHDVSPGLQGLSRFGASDDNESNYPGLSLVMNFLNTLDLYTGDRYRFQAANFAINTSAYCQMGGMGRPYFTGIGSCDALLGERLKVVTRISNAENSEAHSVIQPIEAQLVTDWSRPLAAYLRDGDPQRAWSSWSDSELGLKQRHDDLLREIDDTQVNREDANLSIRRVEQHLSQFIARLDNDTATLLMQDFFKSPKLYSLDEGFRFTQEGVNWFSRYYFSELPYERYKRKQVEEN